MGDRRDTEVEDAAIACASPHRAAPAAEDPGGPARSRVLEGVLEDLPIAVDVTGPDGQAFYANRVARRLPAAPTTEVLHHVTLLAGRRFDVAVRHDTSAQRAIEDDLFRRAFFDELTGLPNRALMERTVGSLIEAGRGDRFALAFIDVDNFKHINDYYGHDAGDQLLIKIAERIGGMIRDTDMLARVGGDELLLLLAPLPDGDDGTAAAARILDRLKEPFFLDGHEVFSSASIGISVFPAHGGDYATLRINADNAMYRVKGGTKGSLRLFDPLVGHAATERTKLEQRLRTAVRDRRLCCAFQPKVDFRQGAVVGVEVLLRWRDEQGLIQAPGGFVDIAVELGLMDTITLQVLDDTMRQIEAIDAAFGPTTSISLNIAARQANDVGFMRRFTEALAATGCAPRFMIELTEEAFIAKTAFQTHVLPLLRAIGTRVSIDDFGVGFSSLAALADITADEIKVDRSFITDIHKRPRNQSVLAAIESLSRALDMNIVVEGVETFEELAYLISATRIRVGQGFYFAKPLVLEAGQSTGLAKQPREGREARVAAVNRQRRSRA